ncbi:MAG: SpoVA/SpoVAEb family sporulation membrane protein [Clostridia bacterium]
MISRDEYCKYVSKNAQKSNNWKTLPVAFAVGGLICMLGQCFHDLYAHFLVGWTKEDIGALTSITMIFLGALLTGLGLYDKIGKVAGAGSIIPITGFANSIVSPAMEFHKEGIIFGLMSKMFVIAGPIIVAGICSSVFVGTIYYIVGLII